MNPLDTRFRGGFPEGHTLVTREGEADGDTGVDFGIWRGSRLEERDAKETVWLLLDGKATLEWPDGKAEVARASVFDEAPYALSRPRGHPRAHRRRGRSGPSPAPPTRAAFAPRLFAPGTWPRSTAARASCRTRRSGTCG